jgi:dihydroorotase
MLDIVISGGSVLTRTGIEQIDVGIADGSIVELGHDLEATMTLDATGAWVGPGFVDLHAHLRDPGEEWKEDIATGTAAAAAGGYTAVVAMPNTVPSIDNAQIAFYVAEQARRVGSANVFPAGAITMGRKGEHMAHIDELWEAGVRIFTDDGSSVDNAAVLRLAMDYIANLGGIVAQHALDSTLSTHGYMHEGSVSSRLGMYGIPTEAEEIVIARDLALVRLTSVRYHLQHVSSARGVELIAAAKDEGLPVSCEVTPHHLAFDHTDVATTDPDFKMMPPLRSEADREALREALASGLIDVVATDHAPHAAREKEVPFEHAPNGVTGFEWAASIAYETIGDDQERFFEAMSMTASSIGQIPAHGLPIATDQPAHLVVFDPQTQWTPTTTKSRSRNAPYFGTRRSGSVRATLLAGKITHEADA